MKKISEFDFKMIYISSSGNILSDALLRLYAYDKPGTVRAYNKHTYLDVADNSRLKTCLLIQLGLGGRTDHARSA